MTADRWDTADEIARDALLCITALVPWDKAQGLLFAAGLAVADAAIAAGYTVEQWAKLTKEILSD